MPQETLHRRMRITQQGRARPASTPSPLPPPEAGKPLSGFAKATPGRAGGERGNGRPDWSGCTPTAGDLPVAPTFITGRQASSATQGPCIGRSQLAFSLTLYPSPGGRGELSLLDKPAVPHIFNGPTRPPPCAIIERRGTQGPPISPRVPFRTASRRIVCEVCLSGFRPRLCRPGTVAARTRPRRRR